jgi:hypothetical protein
MVAPRPARFAFVLAVSIVAGLAGAMPLTSAHADEPPAIDPARNPAGALAADLGPLWECLAGARETFAAQGTVAIGGSGKPMKVAIKLERYDAHAYDLEVTHDDYALVLRRRADATALALPKHQIVHIGRGETDPADHLDPAGIGSRLVSSATQASFVSPILLQPSPASLTGLLVGLLGVKHDSNDGRWERGDGWLDFDDAGRRISANAEKVELDLAVGEAGECRAVDDFPGYRVSEVPRDEIERTLCRGVRRALEIALPGAELTAPLRDVRAVPHGKLEWAEGLRVVTLHGSPEEIGRAHGELLAVEANRCVDSVLHVVGTVETIRGGTWFRKKLDDAAARLAPHIPERHLRETRALAESLHLDPGLVAVVNIFPELFHCSGFAVSGTATTDGTLYHGRVLDYMTEIGLQDAAAAFIVAPEGQIPFVTIGYAGFIGSVSGMNAQGISLGEMGGRGEGQWDGVPMATLMRRAMEECTTLDEVMALWTDSPRTCEYYYVFADGKTRRSVGVAATPERIEFVQPGEGHELLGTGIPDSVVLSAGDRLLCLRERVKEQFGKIDEEAAIHLMDRPVAMKSNLHNVLFVPEKLLLHVAHASHKKPAAECPSVRLDLKKLLEGVPGARGAAAPPTEAAKAAALPGAMFRGSDSLATGAESNDDARKCLDGLCWDTGTFDVAIEKAEGNNGDLRVRFPSPLPAGPACNRDVWMEWYQARDGEGEVCRGPACVVVHESGSGMTVGRIVARGLSAHGVHALMVQMPYYGARRPKEGKAGAEMLVPAVRQAVADVRRARDATAALPLVDASRIAVQGTSLGGFVTATVAGLDEGYDKVFILLAGGDLVGVLEKGKKDAEKVREKLSESGMTEEQIKETLHAIEPTRLAHRYRPECTWIFSGKYDDVVPLSHCQLLADAGKLPEDHHVQMEANHYSGIIYLPMVMARIAEEIHGRGPAAKPAAPPAAAVR